MNLRKFTFFSALSDVQLKKISSTLQIRHVEPNEVICHKGEKSEELYLVISGRLQVIEITEDGREIGLNYIESGSLMGELSVIDGLPRSADIVAIEKSTIGCLPKADAHTLFYTIPEMAELMMRHLARIIRTTNQQRVILSIPNAYQRIYAHLISLAQAAPGGLTVVQNMPKQQQIAIMLNTSRETVSRAIRELELKGIVEKDLRRLIIRRPEILKDLMRPGNHDSLLRCSVPQ